MPGWEPPGVEELLRALPQYEISHFIARGCMGAVYRGTQKSLQRTVAIKVLPPGLDDGDRQFTARFKHEAQTMARLTHPNIVTVYEAGENEEGWLYIVMEFIDGTDVGQLIASEGMVEPRRAIQITSAVCEALAFAHEEGIIHRDIKPSNIMLDRKGRVKVADFGLAKMVNVDTTAFSSATATVGTPEFIAPEAHMAGTQVDHRADIYAVGVMLYQMLTGQIPRGKFSPPSSVVPQVDQRLDGIVDKALQTNREQRYRTAAEMKHENDSVVPDFNPQTSADPQRPEPTKRHGRIRVAALIAVLAVVGMGAFNVMKKPAKWSAPSPVRSDAAEPSETTAQRTVRTTSATKDAPFVNSLGMKFVPAPITGGPTAGQLVLFSVWDTRVQDYAAFVTETQRDWPKPEFGQGPTHPAVMVSWDDATAFCAWLTERERRVGQLGADERYRLPGDHEWSCGVGIGGHEDAAMLPVQNDKKLGDVFPWASTWPPPDNTGNYQSGELEPARAAGKYPWTKSSDLPGYQDGFAGTSPVDTFPANRFGLHDMGGNVWQWCEDCFDAEHKKRVVRGASWVNGSAGALRSSYRNHYPTDHRAHHCGFRCVPVGPPPQHVVTPASISAPTPAQAGEIVTFAGHRYQFVAGNIPWAAATAKVESMGGHLATINSKEENTWLKKTFDACMAGESNKNCWLGGYAEDKNKPWRWVTGEPFDFQDWHTSEPNYDYGAEMPAPPPYGLHLHRKSRWDSPWFESEVRFNRIAGFLVEWDTER